VRVTTKLRSKAGRKQLTRNERLSAILAAIAAVIGVLSGSVALVDWIGGKVDPPAPAPPSEIDARISRVSLRTEGERLVDYLRETNQSTAAVTTFQGNERGYVFVTRVRLKGNQAKRVSVRWSVIDDAGQPLAGRIYTQTAVVFVPRGPNQARTWPIWVPSPPAKGTYRLRVTLVDQKRQPLDEANSDPFTLTRAPEP
jgi:hypothetical protein